MKHCSFFERPTVKQLAITAFFALAGFAVGNAHQTAEALRGQYQWCTEHEKQTVRRVVPAAKAEQRRVDDLADLRAGQTAVH